jgi:hypothetical protein
MRRAMDEEERQYFVAWVAVASIAIAVAVLLVWSLFR